MKLIRRTLALLAFLPAALAAQVIRVDPMPVMPPIPRPDGYRVYITTDMEGIASVVFNREIISGYEGERYRNGSSQDYWEHYREILTGEVNAAISGARRGGSRSFVVNEGHGGNLFGNILPWQLDTAAILVRGWPKPMVMSTGLDSSANAAFLVGFHAGALTPGTISHTYAFDRITINGRWVNETGINALVAGEYGVPVALVSGDDVTIQQARDQLGAGFVGVVTKWAIGRNAGATLSPAVVRQMLMDSAAVAVRRAQRGEVRPFTLDRPYTVDFDLRASFPQEYVTGVDSLQGFRVQKTGARSYRFVTSDAREMARLFDAIELVVLR
jgi:D-amino peptidase